MMRIKLFFQEFKKMLRQRGYKANDISQASRAFSEYLVEYAKYRKENKVKQIDTGHFVTGFQDYLRTNYPQLVQAKKEHKFQKKGINPF